MHVALQLFQHHFLKDYYFLHCMLLAPLLKNQLTKWVHFWDLYFFSIGLSILTSVPFCLDYPCLVVKVLVPSFVPLFQDCFFFEKKRRNWSRSVLSDSLRPHGLESTRLLYPWNFPGKSTGVGCHFLLQGILWNPMDYRVSFVSIYKEANWNFW